MNDEHRMQFKAVFKHDLNFILISCAPQKRKKEWLALRMNEAALKFSR
jgi:hypothetical protein